MKHLYEQRFYNNTDNTDKNLFCLKSIVINLAKYLIS